MNSRVEYKSHAACQRKKETNQKIQRLFRTDRINGNRARLGYGYVRDFPEFKRVVNARLLLAVGVFPVACLSDLQLTLQTHHLKLMVIYLFHLFLGFKQLGFQRLRLGS